MRKTYSSSFCGNSNKAIIYSDIKKRLFTISKPDVLYLSKCTSTKSRINYAANGSVFWGSRSILGMFEGAMQPLKRAQSKSLSPALLIRGPAISVWVVVLWCKDSKMSGSLVDQVNHVLSRKQRSSAVAIIALTSWLTECFTANAWSCGRQWVPAKHKESLKVEPWKHINNRKKTHTKKQWLCVFSATACNQFCILHLTHKQTSMSCWSVLKSPDLKSYFNGTSLDVWSFSCKNMKTIDNAIDKYMDDIEQGKTGQIITILPIWRDPSPDIGLNPRNNWCMQSQIGSPPKIWAHYFIRWSHILRAKIICVSNTEIQILLVPIMSAVSQTISKTVWLSDRKCRPPLNANINDFWFFFLFFF